MENRNPLSPIFNSRSSIQLWTPTQRRSVLILSMILLVFLAVESLRKSAVLVDPPLHESPRAAEIADRLDPNVADAAALAAIPELGEKRAADIVDYREKFALHYPGQSAFGSPEDLMRVKGIGLATVANLRPYLIFPQDLTVHRPTSDFSPK